MTATPALIVVGAPGLAVMLEATTRFAQVTSCATVAELQRATREGNLGTATPEQLLFLFADRLTADHDNPNVTVATLVSRLCAKKFKVVVLETSPAGREIVTATPAAGLLPMPVSTNMVLAAVKSLGFAPMEPCSQEWAHQVVTYDDPDAARQLLTTTTAPHRDGDLDEIASFLDSFDSATAATATTAATTATASASESWSPAEVSDGSAEPAVSEPSVSSPSVSGPVSSWNVVAPPRDDSHDPSTSVPIGSTAVEEPNPWNVPTSPSPVSDMSPVSDPSTETSWGAETETSWGADGVVTDSNPWSSADPVSETSSPWVAADNSTDDMWPTDTGSATPGRGSAATLSWDLDGDGSSDSGPSVPDPRDSGDPPTSTASSTSSWSAVPAESVDEPMPLQGGFHTSTTPDRRGLVIAVAVPKGGAGKSTLTLNLAVWLGLRSRASGRRVCVVDANFQQADIGKMINAVRPNIADLANHPEDQNPQRISRHLLQRRDLNTDFLLGPSRILDSNPFWINAGLYAHAVESLRTLYDYVFVDTPVAEFHHDLFREFVVPHCDFLLVPITPNLATMMNADAWLREVTADVHQGGYGHDRKRTGLVLNMEEEGVGYDEDQVRSELANWNFLGSVPASKAWRRAANEGEIVAARNYAEVNESFGLILSQITGDRSLLPTTPTAAPKKGFLGRLIKR